MAIKNRYEYLSGILEALDVEHTEAEVHNNEVWRSKVLDGMGVEHTYDDINQTDLWRAKVIEGINAMAGGGGSSDLNNPILLELTDVGGDLNTSLTVSEIYALCQNGTPYFIVTTEQNATYGTSYMPNAKYFINQYFTEEWGLEVAYNFKFVLLGIANTTTETVTTALILDGLLANQHITISGSK